MPDAEKKAEETAFSVINSDAGQRVITQNKLLEG
jgi:hypothetical protein